LTVWTKVNTTKLLAEFIKTLKRRLESRNREMSDWVAADVIARKRKSGSTVRRFTPSIQIRTLPSSDEDEDKPRRANSRDPLKVRLDASRRTDKHRLRSRDSARGREDYDADEEDEA